MPPAEVVRGPCAVAAAGCLGVLPSKNADHAEGDGHGKYKNWRWTRVTMAGALTFGDERCGAAESAWEVGDESWACGACKSLATAPPKRGARAEKVAAAELAGLHTGAPARAAAPAAAAQTAGTAAAAQPAERPDAAAAIYSTGPAAGASDVVAAERMERPKQ